MQSTNPSARYLLILCTLKSIVEVCEYRAGGFIFYMKILYLISDTVEKEWWCQYSSYTHV